MPGDGGCGQRSTSSPKFYQEWLVMLRFERSVVDASVRHRRTAQVRFGQVRIAQVRPGQVRPGQVRPGQVCAN